MIIWLSWYIVPSMSKFISFLFQVTSVAGPPVEVQIKVGLVNVKFTKSG